MDDMELPSYREGSSLAVVPDSVNIPPPCYSKPPSYKESASADEQRCSYDPSDLESGDTAESQPRARNCLGRFWKILKQSILKIAPITSVVLWFSV